MSAMMRPRKMMSRMTMSRMRRRTLQDADSVKGLLLLVNNRLTSLSSDCSLTQVEMPLTLKNALLRSHYPEMMIIHYTIQTKKSWTPMNWKKPGEWEEDTTTRGWLNITCNEQQAP